MQNKKKSKNTMRFVVLFLVILQIVALSGIVSATAAGDDKYPSTSILGQMLGEKEPSDTTTSDVKPPSSDPDPSSANPEQDPNPYSSAADSTPYTPPVSTADSNPAVDDSTSQTSSDSSAGSEKYTAIDDIASQATAAAPQINYAVTEGTIALKLDTSAQVEALGNTYYAAANDKIEIPLPVSTSSSDNPTLSQVLVKIVSDDGTSYMKYLDIPDNIPATPLASYQVACYKVLRVMDFLEQA